ncbi:WAP four-disulfide core domain protein 2-like [Salarias fasciatus]|uniref:WAP four-disulfide core domain protein 2-like n=1 Tax=Salarias fasciatus TaxID=181472 RepID=UPI001176AC57|nr:WAP four-disulfide core domain protein 2-like [Salarias fasciatus]
MEKIYLTVSLLVFAFVHFGPVSTLSGLNPRGCPHEKNRRYGMCTLFPGYSSCLTDDDCSRGLNCCSYRCGRKCVALVPIPDVKPGLCPDFDDMAFCEHECDHDYDCEADQKCCSNGCGNVCTTPFKDTDNSLKEH